MRKSTVALLLSCTIAFTPASSYATGIPTLDSLSAAIQTSNALAQAKQALDALKVAKQGIEEARDQYEAYKALLTGNADYARFLNNPKVNRVFPVGEWMDLYEDAVDLPKMRQRYNLYSANAEIQRQFDEMLSVVGALELNYEASNERVTNAEALRNELSRVQTPQEKQDLQLRFQLEYIELQNQQMRLQNIQALAEQKEKVENKQKSREFVDHLRGKG